MSNGRRQVARRRGEEEALEAAREALEAEIATRDGLEDEAEISFRADLEERRREWARGTVPEDYERRYMFMHARSFLMAVDRATTLIRLLVNDNAPAGVADALAAFEARVPRVRDLRNAVAHFDDRIRGLARRRALELQPIDNSLIRAPAGGVLALENLNGSKFGSIVEDGSYVELDVSIATAEAVRDCIQAVLASYEWEGEADHQPRWSLRG